MTDLTKITTPFGLLDKETQEAMRAHGGPYQLWTADNGWFEVKQPSWGMANAYRVRPAREWWIHPAREAVSEYHPNPDGYFEVNGYILVREVMG